MEQISEKLESIKKAIVELFPDAGAAFVYGSIGDDYIQGISDIDIIIVGPQNKQLSDKLITLNNYSKDVDPIYISQNDLTKSKFKCRGPNRDYELHGFDLYRVKNHSKILFGDVKLLELFPNISLHEALLDTLPHIIDVFIPDLRKKLNEQDEINNWINKNLNVMLVVARAVYTIETKQYGSKLASLEYLKNTHKEFVDLFEYIKRAYLKEQATDQQIQAKNIKLFLDLAEKTLNEYSRFKNI